MPSRKKRIGKFGCESIESVYEKEEKRALSSVLENWKEKPNTVYWAPEYLQAACERLTASGKLKVSPFNKHAFWLVEKKG